MSSLKGRLTAGLIVTVTVVFSLQWLLVNLAIRKATENYMASRLEHDIESLLAALTFDERGALSLSAGRVSMVYEQPFSGHYYRITAGNLRLRSRSLWDQDLPIQPLPPGDTLRLYRSGPQGQPLLLLVKGFAKHGLPITVAVGEDLTPIKQDIKRFQRGYLVLSLSLVGVLILLQRYSVVRALAPLQQVRGTLHQISHGKAEALSGDVPEEIRPLAQEINRLLELLKRRLTKTRSALGSLAHALKTPLTLLLQLANDSALQGQPNLHEQLITQTTAIRELIERELKRAQLAGSGPSGARFDPANDLPVMAEVLKRMHIDKPLDIRLDLPQDLSFAADREDMLELLGNLADNACKWARGRVFLTLGEDPQGLTILVEDDGPGCSSQQLAQLGLRPDESSSGHGLGLAIVGDIVRGYGGQLAFARSETLGGLEVRISLPKPREENE